MFILFFLKVKNVQLLFQFPYILSQNRRGNCDELKCPTGLSGPTPKKTVID